MEYISFRWKAASFPRGKGGSSVNKVLVLTAVLIIRNAVSHSTVLPATSSFENWGEPHKSAPQWQNLQASVKDMQWRLAQVAQLVTEQRTEVLNEYESKECMRSMSSRKEERCSALLRLLFPSNAFSAQGQINHPYLLWLRSCATSLSPNDHHLHLKHLGLASSQPTFTELWP